MKNVINYYYDIIVNELKKRESSFIFNIGNSEFELIEYYGDINRLMNMYSILNSYRRDVDQIVRNKQNSFITYYENKSYILLKKTPLKRKKLNLNDIAIYDCNVYLKEDINWKNLWISKIDYYEMQLEETGKKYPILKKTFSYYLGLSELAINLLNYVNYKNVNNFISHRRLEKEEEIYNPLNIIIDSRTRDVGEYIKMKYFNDDIDSFDIVEFIKQSRFSKDEMLLLLARLIYPSYYFDIYEKIYSGKESEGELEKLIKKNAEYEAFLKNIYNNIKFMHGIPQIEFLEY